MTLFTLAIKQVRHRARSYTAYFLSSAFAAWLFLLYRSLLFHPALAQSPAMADVGSLLGGVSVVVAGFSGLFILYAQNAFLKVRMRELGLFTVLGLTDWQRTRTILYETMTVGLLATTAGVGLGVALTPLMNNLAGLVFWLAEPLPFYLPVAAIGQTYLVFGLIFGAMAFISYWVLKRTPLIVALRSERRPSVPPRRSPWLAMIGAGSLGGFYWAFLSGSVFRSEPAVPLSFALGLIGTYLFFTQSMGYLLTLAPRWKGLYLQGTGLLVISQLRAKLTENARILFMVSILAALVITFIGAGVSAQMDTQDYVAEFAPVSLQVLGEPAGITPDLVRQRMRESGVALEGEAHVPVILGEARVGGTPFLGPGGVLIADNGARDWVVSLKLDGAIPVVKDGAVTVGRFDHTFPSLSFLIGDKPAVDLAVRHERATLLNSYRTTNFMVVVPGALFDQLAQNYPDAVTTLHGYRTPHWRDVAPVYRPLLAQLVAHDPNTLTMPYLSPLIGTITHADDERRNQGLMMFVTGFLGLLFFLAAGNMLFFKLFTDLAGDKQQYQALARVGLSRNQARDLINMQSAILFFAPFMVATVHALVIAYSMDDSPTSLVPGVVLTILAYFGLHGCYYLISRRAYARAVFTT